MVSYTLKCEGGGGLHWKLSVDGSIIIVSVL